MKKIGILTIHSNANPGSMLQAYALQQTVQRITGPAYQCDIINYMIPHLFWNRSSGNILPLRIMIYLYFHYANRKYLRFKRKYLSLSPSKPLKASDLKDISKKYSNIIVGSDQIWNVKSGAYWDPNYLLNWVDQDTRKVAYAASFGLDSLEDTYTPIFREALPSYSALSVREYHGVDIIDKAIGIKPEWVLDPTLLIDKEEWKKMAIKPKEENYIFVYCINRSEETERVIRDIAKKRNLKILQCTVGLKSLMKDVKTVRFVSPEEWIGYILYAKFVVVSSFHGAAFSINLNKQFLVDAGDYRQSRIKSILKLFSLESRLITKDTNNDTISDIDYQNSGVNQRLSEEREKSISFLKKNIK